MFKYFKITILIILLLLLIVPQTVSAALVPCGRSEDDPGTPDINETEPCNLCHIFLMLQILISGISIAVLAWAVIFIVIGGIAIITSGGSPDKASQGKRTITYAFIGVAIAFGAWLIINIVMNELVNPDRFPWPWNQIKCAPTESVYEEEEPEPEGRICCCDLGGDGFTCSTYNNEEECAADCQTHCEGYAAYRHCCIDEQRRCSSTPDPEMGQYCVCETPVYDLNPDDFPGEAHIVGTNVRTKNLEGGTECAQECTAENASTYCASTLRLSEASLYCTNKEQLESRNACSVGMDDNTDCQVSTQWFPKNNPGLDTCINNSSCIDLVTPGSPVYDPDLAKRCWREGQLICRCEKKRSCATDSNCCQLYRFVGEMPHGGNSIFDCGPVYGTTNNSCRLNCQYDSCRQGPVAQWCQRSAPAGSETWQLNPPPGGAKEEQKGDASSRLTSFLNCMYEKLPALTINSISSNTLCDDPDCDTTGSGCGHAANSCHYGGTNCTGMSYAVDFHTNVSCSDIKQAAEECDSTAWVNWENSHTHVSVNNRNCGCNESAEGNPCP